MLNMLQKLLEHAFPSHEILAAAEGAAGLEILERRRPDVALVDYKMPKLDGLELAMEAHERGLDTPIIMMSAFADSGLEARVRQAPTVRAFFHKPLDPPELVGKIRTILQSRRPGRSGNRVPKPAKNHPSPPPPPGRAFYLDIRITRSSGALPASAETNKSS